MKKLLLVFFFCISGQNSHALSKNIAIPMASLDFAVRCESWLQGSWMECSKLSSAMLSALDADWDESKKSLAFFFHDLMKLASDSQTLIWLKSVNLELQLLSQGASDGFDLYESARVFVSKRFPKADADQGAHRLLAVLFQDNVAQYHLEWLKLKRQLKFRDFISNLKQVLDLLNPRVTQSIDYSRVKLYPSKIEREREHFNEKMYYYYLPWYLARALEGKTEQKNLARTMPLMMSLIYKYHHAYKKKSDSIVELGFKTMAMKPEPTMQIKDGKYLVTDSSWSYRYRDLYMAYLGSQNAQTGREVLEYHVFEKWIGLHPVTALSLIAK